MDTNVILNEMGKILAIKFLIIIINIAIIIIIIKTIWQINKMYKQQKENTIMLRNIYAKQNEILKKIDKEQ